MFEPADVRGAREPSHVSPSNYGIDASTGQFIHPDAAPFYPHARPLADSLDYLEDREYRHNMTVHAHWPIVVSPSVCWQQIIDWDGRRYMYNYFKTRLNIYDITDPRELKVLVDRKFAPGETFGASTIAFNAKLGKWLMLQSAEVPRGLNVMGDGGKYAEPERVAELIAKPMFRGFRVFELTSPTEWHLLAEVSTDALHPHARVQQGSGALDVPTYHGGRYAFIAAAPDNTFVNQEYPNYVYSPGQLIYDLEDPTQPRLVSAWWVPGQRLGEDDAYRRLRQHGNRTSWLGARMPIAVNPPLEQGGRYGYAVMGGLGFHVIDLADPANPVTVGSLDLPLNVGGVEGDNVDASRAAELGIVLVNGYPMNEDGYEPYKDIFVIDVKEPAHPAIIGVLPRPMPPADAPYADFALRRGKFGPKRPGYYFQPGRAHPGIAIYPFMNAGIQVFDIRDPARASIAAYFVPRMAGDLADPHSYATPMENVFIEWDRKLIWAFGNTGIYLLSTPALGEPDFGPPRD
ncbi:hypothetical protein LJ656_10785 [Paraburkholderia sp. MMS20-SJTR3]|uniref:LVIVD repeat-containing protein n=1 Tax=Paraburkholderia sejongensis TaxID=2886946 RepID=A0ABS8JTK8_9BURK|nr:hypothetical protein [Paraburkholderia sp. MMS20-SJTR3]MCC8393075.1 hypothetical protein [Paraburkholderia sp. MMS20-SJTR3]